MDTDKGFTLREIKKLMILSYKRYQEGTISETQAFRENTMLANIIRATKASRDGEASEQLELAIRRKSSELNTKEDEAVKSKGYYGRYSEAEGTTLNTKRGSFPEAGRSLSHGSRAA